MDDRRTAEGVEHLQAAARELLGAARAFLDVVEDVVEDSDRLSGAAEAVSDLVRNGMGIIRPRPEPWEPSAWSGDESDDRTGSASWWDEPYEDDDPRAGAEEAADQPAEEPAVGEPDPEEPPPAKPTAGKATAKKAAAKKPATSRVRRIAVD